MEWIPFPLLISQVPLMDCAILHTEIMDNMGVGSNRSTAVKPRNSLRVPTASDGQSTQRCYFFFKALDTSLLD